MEVGVLVWIAVDRIELLVLNVRKELREDLPLKGSTLDCDETDPRDDVAVDISFQEKHQPIWDNKLGVLENIRASTTSGNLSFKCCTIAQSSSVG